MSSIDLTPIAPTTRRTNYRSRRRRARFLLYVILIAGAVVMVLPFAYMIGTALNPERWILPYPPTIWPAGATLANFARAWTEAGLQHYMVNSAIISGVTVVLAIAVSTTSAFAFARLRFPGRELIFSLYLVTMMIPDMIALLPKFQVMRDFGLTNSWTGLWIIYVSNAVAFNTFLLRAFFQRVPRDLEDAARIDGGGPWTFYWRILMPLAKPAVATVAVFTFLGAWDDFWWARLLIQDPGRRTLPIGILLFFNAHGTQWSAVFAATTLAAIPEILVFVVLQRYFVSGLFTGAVRG
jgi:ABC-type glycerol-3-phosphate transport system permease component